MAKFKPSYEMAKRRSKKLGPNPDKRIEELQTQNQLNGMKHFSSARKHVLASERKYSETLSRGDLADLQSKIITEHAMAIAEAMKEQAKLNDPNYKKMNFKQKAEYWDIQFSKAAERLLSIVKIKNKKLVEELINGTEAYLSLPERIHMRRCQHPNQINKIRRRLKRFGITPEENLMVAVQEILKDNRTGRTSVGKAMHVCLAASFFADLKESQGTNWTSAYKEGMQHVFPSIKDNPQILRAIRNFK